MKTIPIRKFSIQLLGLFILLAVFVYGFFWQSGYYAVLPVTYNDAGLPVVYVTISAKKYPLTVDTGSKLEVSLYERVLDTIAHESYGIEKFQNFLGTKFERPTYKVPSIKLGSVTFSTPIVVGRPEKDRQVYMIKGSVEKQNHPDQPVGILGRGLLKKTNMLIDMQHSKIILAKNPSQLKKGGYNLDLFAKVPFILDPKGIFIDIETDLGTKRFLLDTGFTLTMVHKNFFSEEIDLSVDKYDIPFSLSKKFSIGRCDFGSKKLYLIKMTKELNVLDGILGMDFIEKHAIYIDFSNSFLYIEK